jgi:hypothetical protein
LGSGKTAAQSNRQTVFVCQLFMYFLAAAAGQTRRGNFAVISIA